MVEPRHQPIAPTGRYSGIRELPQKNWDRNKARMESIYQLPMRDFRTTAAQFGVPPSVADITTTEKGIPRMECTTTTKNDYCAPSLDRYIKVQGVCPERDYPSSSGLEYCPGRETDAKPLPQLPTNLPPMPRSCPVSLLPKIGPVPQLRYPPSLPQYPSFKNDEFFATPSEQPDYTSQVDYLSAKKGFKWPTPTDQYTNQGEDREIQGRSTLVAENDKYENMNIDKTREDHHKLLEDQGGAGDFCKQIIDYRVESDDHAEKRILHDAMLERTRRDYEQNIGIPGSTIPLVKAGKDPPNAVAHYDVPNYTQGSAAGGIIRSKFGAPNWEMKVPITDPSFPNPEYKITQPEAGLTKSTYSVMPDEDKGTAGVAHIPPARFPDKIYNSARYSESDKVGTSSLAGDATAKRYIPSIIEAQDKLIPTRTQQIIQTSEAKMERAQRPNELPTETHSITSNVEPLSLKGLRRIQTSNQVYGSWIDDPHLKDNDWWFKARPTNPRTKTYLTRYKEENGWK